MTTRSRSGQTFTTVTQVPALAAALHSGLQPSPPQTLTKQQHGVCLTDAATAILSYSPYATGHMFKFNFVPRLNTFHGWMNPNKVIQTRKSFHSKVGAELLDPWAKHVVWICIDIEHAVFILHRYLNFLHWGSPDMNIVVEEDSRWDSSSVP